MIVRLDCVGSEPSTWQEVVELSPAALRHPEVVDLSPVEVSGSVTPAGRDFLLEARLCFRVTVACDRCTGPVHEQVESVLRLVAVPNVAPTPGEGEVALRSEELGVVELPGEELDTAPLVAEQVQLELPARPLCRPDCAGLCPRCGANLNEGPCGCAPDDGDPRWAALAGLMTKLGRGE